MDGGEQVTLAVRRRYLAAGKRQMTVTYVIHKYAGTFEDRTVTVTGEAAKLVLTFQNEQAKIGITILEVDDGSTD